MLNAWLVKLLTGLCAALFLWVLFANWQADRARKAENKAEDRAQLAEGRAAGLEKGLAALETVERTAKLRVEHTNRIVQDVRSQPVTTACVQSPSVAAALGGLRAHDIATVVADPRQPSDVQTGRSGPAS